MATDHTEAQDRAVVLVDTLADAYVQVGAQDKISVWAGLVAAIGLAAEHPEFFGGLVRDFPLPRTPGRYDALVARFPMAEWSTRSP